ncbi:hypothetical protein IHE44_0003203 [Lamprotornis superbus]|uniref:NF-kappa-B-repressing factor n=1 Tax=Lamprotornis superbus TaxID=245042 RepID=A0A835NM68_9PASS|nr:hypothetical protein IHE44_0003203 [Lamprotornis superbus]
MEKVLKMAEGIDIGEMRSYELVPNRKLKRYRSPSDSPEPEEIPEPPKKVAPRFRVRPRFEPIHFVTSAEKDDKKDNSLDNHQEANTNSVAQPAENCTNSFVNAREVDPQLSSLGPAKPSLAAAAKKAVNSVDSTTSSALQVSVSPSTAPSASETFPSSAIMVKQSFMEKLSAAVWKNLTNPDANTGTDKINFTYLLTRSIQACKTNPEYIYPGTESTKGSTNTSKHWTSFVLTENASDAIGILNNSASYNKMSVEYKYELMPNRSWRCQVYLQDHCLAEGFGTKKTSKHAAAEEALKILQKMQSNIASIKVTQVQKVGCSSRGSGRKKDLKDLVIYENSNNPVCTLNDTAQFNKMTVEYVFERMTGMRWKCKVMLEDEFIAEAVGVKKSVKHEAAEEAVKILKKTQPTVVNNLKKGTVEDVISRNEIRGRSAEEAFKQKIKEDNIGNQILRKMGWTGGGLGKDGEGIREPISVKEQFKREGLGLDVERVNRIAKRDIEEIIRNYARSDSHIDLTFSRDLTMDERKQIHQIAQKYGLKSKSHGQGHNRYLVVSRKRRKEDLLDQLKQEGQGEEEEERLPWQAQTYVVR